MHLVPLAIFSTLMADKSANVMVETTERGQGMITTGGGMITRETIGTEDMKTTPGMDTVTGETRGRDGMTKTGGRLPEAVSALGIVETQMKVRRILVSSFVLLTHST